MGSFLDDRRRYQTFFMPGIPVVDTFLHVPWTSEFAKVTARALAVSGY